MGRKRNLGLAVGCLWLVVVSTSFAAVSLLVVRSAAATVLLVAIFLLAVVLVVMSIATLRAVFPVQDTTEPRPSEGRRLGRRFGAIAGVEGLVLTIVTLACVFTRRWALIAPLDLMIVGLHFLPLAKLFNVPRYNITGALFCGIPIATMLLFPAERLVGHALSWFVVPSVGCAAVAFVTAWAGLREVARFIHVPRSNVA